MRRCSARLACCLVLLAFAVTLAASAETLVSVTFDQKGWDPGTWVIAKNPGVPHLGKWVQREKCIENETPTDPARKSALDATLTTMVYGKRFAGDCTAAATFEIGAGAAPGIVIAQDWAPDAEGQPQYGEFYEVVIYEKGVNLWHHFTKDGKPLYELTAYCNFSLKADTAYKLQVTRKAKTLEMSIAGQRMGVLVPALANELYFGVEGCEGVCRVYDFAVTR